MFKSKFLGVGLAEGLAKGFSWLSLSALPFFVDSAFYGELLVVYSLLLAFVPFVLIGQDRELLAVKKVSKIFFVKSLSLTFLHLVVLLFLMLVVSTFYPIKKAYFAVAVSAWFFVLNKLYLSKLRAEARFNIYSANRVLYGSLRFLLIFSLVVYFKDILIYASVEGLAALLVSLPLLSLLPKSTSWNFKGLVEKYKRGFPLAVHGMSVILLAYSDKFVLNYYLSSSAVGDYGFAYSLASAIIFVFTVVAVVSEPRIYQADSEIELRKTNRNTIFTMTVLGLIVSVLVFLVYFIIFQFNLLESYSYEPLIMLLLLFGQLVWPIYLVSNYNLVRIGKAKALVKCTIFSMIINILINIIFIPKAGIIVAALATVVSNSCLALLTARAVRLKV